VRLMPIKAETKITINVKRFILCTSRVANAQAQTACRSRSLTMLD
jgi:hypothetical protein